MFDSKHDPGCYPNPGRFPSHPSWVLAKPGGMRRVLLAFFAVAAIVAAFVPSAALGQQFVAVNSSFQFAGSGTTHSFSIGTVTAGDSLAVFIWWLDTTATLNSVTACGDNLTLVNNPTTNRQTRTAGAYIVSSTGGTCTLAATFSADVESDILVHEVSGTGGFDGSGINTQTNVNPPPPNGGTATSPGITTTVNGDYIFGATAYVNTTTTPGTGFTNRFTGSSSIPISSEDEIQTTAGSITATFTNSGTQFSDFDTIIMALQPAAATCLTGTALWSGIICPSRAIDWSKAGVPGGINQYANRSLCQNVYNGSGAPGTSLGVNGDLYWETDNNTSWKKSSGTWGTTGHALGADIATAINACSSGTYLSLSAGTYTSSSGVTITTNSVTLRGSGPNQTILKFTGGDACGGLGADVCVINGDPDCGGCGSPSNVANWTAASYAPGTTNITISNITCPSQPCTIPQQNQLIFLDQLDDPPQDTGNIWVCQVLKICSQQIGSENGRPGFSYLVTNATWASGNATLTITIPQGSTNQFSVGQPINVAGVNPSGYNGAFVVTSTAATTVSYSLAANPGTCSLPLPSGDVCGAAAYLGRGQQQPVQVQGVSGCGSGCYNVTISPGLYMPNWSGTKSPQAWWSNSQPVTGVGIENLTLDNSATVEQSSDTAGIWFYNGYGNWVKNVRDINSPHEHVMLYQSAHNTIRDSYFYGSFHAASASYGVDTYNGADNLIENNVFQHVASPMITEGCVGCVFAYNYALDDWYENGDTAWQQASASGHSVGDSYTLWEGNEGIGLQEDNIHGTRYFVTAFRNYWNGQDPAGGSTGGKMHNTNAVELDAYNRYFNIIGNVLGTQNYHTSYQKPASSTTDCGDATIGNVSVFTLGYSRGEGTQFAAAATCGYAPQSFNLSDDTLVATTLMRWGNYDVKTNAVRWCGNSSDTGWTTTCVDPVTNMPKSEIPTGLFKNDVPRQGDTQSKMPASFYLSSQPSWWVTGTSWPGIGPDITNGDIPNVGGYAYNIPSEVCYNNNQLDANYHPSGTTYSVSSTPPPVVTDNGNGTFTIKLTTTLANSFAVGQLINVDGITPSTYNGPFIVTGQTSTTVSYLMTSNPGAYSSGGVVSYPPIKAFGDSGTCSY